MNTDVNHSLTMLLVDDNLADVVFFREALRETGICARVEVVHNGQQAMYFLRRQGEFAEAARPDVVVLDLNMPLKNGREVLAEMASDPALNTIPVVVMTTSPCETWICEKYPNGRCLYFTKTADFSLLQDILRQIAAHARAIQ